MANSIVHSDNAFSTLELTLRANEVTRFPAVRTPLSTLFEVENISDRNASIDVESATLPALTDGTWGTVITLSQVSRERKNFALAAPKVGKTFDVGPAEIQSIRRTGEVTRESLQSVQDRKLGQVFVSLDDYHERARLAGILGRVINNAGATVADLRGSAYYNTPANPVLGLELDAANPAPGALRMKFAALKRLIDDRLQIGNALPSAYEIQANSELFDQLRWHPETMEAFKRWEDLARPEGSPVTPFRFAGFDIYDYNRSGLASGRGVVIPRGVAGMYKTIVTPGDFVDVLNEPGFMRYVSVEPKDHKKGFEYEVSTNTLHICSRPEAIFEVDIGAGDNDTNP
ncbi:MAG: hypothetical protein FJX25_09845 [Alphaproteobacteria bacterium]|nr:hypothetical protein [Alphaproteobacteria bacterium]